MTATLQDSLFPEPREAVIARCDAEILGLLTGAPGGPRGMTLEEDEKKVLRELRFRRGLQRALTIRDLHAATGIGARTIKEIVRNLRLTFRLPIGSSKRGAEGGYYLMVTAEDEAAWVNDVLSQVKAEMEVVRAAVRGRESLERLRQLSMEGASNV
jgi:hypothetical protein